MASYARFYYEETGKLAAAASLLSEFRSRLRSYPDPTLSIGR
jgi:hypothetical protein